jgi:hypothetical protein
MLISHPGRRGRPTIAAPKMIVVKDRIFYTPSPEAYAVIIQWPRGVSLTWEIDDDSLQPQFVHLTPALNQGLKLQITIGAVGLPTRVVGEAIPNGSVAVAEAITDTEVTVTVPFQFTVVDRRIADRRVTAVAAE